MGSCILHQTVGVGFFALAFKQSCSMYTFSVILIIVARDRKRENKHKKSSQ